MTRRDERIFIAGNGPSLRELDFDLLRDRDWLGMNAAYRYWDRVGIYPKLYCCLDKVVIKSHADQILRLHAEGLVERFFLVRDILEAIPDFPTDDRVFFLEDMVASDAPGSEIFRTAFSDKKTTGSWAVRFAIFQGYRDIVLGGIDCNYVEIIREAESTGVGLELKIGSEVASNPNYFFHDYQQQGDTYQVPNPERHFGNLHLQSFEALNVDVACLGLDVRIRNTSRTSQLHRFGVYEHVPLTDVFDVPALQAVAVPLTIGELPQLLDSLALWEEPAFLPLRPESPLRGRIDLRVFFDGEPADGIVEALREAWARLPGVRGCFRKLEVTFLGIPADLNQYVRDRKRRDVPRKMGPNLQFLATLRECRGYRFTQLMETDCVPAKADWLTDLDAICRGTAPAWIAGAFVTQQGVLDQAFVHHINGNALYATGDGGFQAFMDDTFIPALRHLILERRDHDLAYDCLVSKLMHGGFEDDVLKQHAAVVQRNLDKFRPVTAIANLSLTEAGCSDADLLAELDGDRVLVHSRRLASLLAKARSDAHAFPPALPADGVLARRFLDTFLKIPAHASHAFHCYTNLDGCTIERFDRARGLATVAFAGDVPVAAGDGDRGAFIVFALYRPTRGRQLECRVRIAASAAQRVRVKFSRHGQGAFVEGAAEVDLVGGQPSELRLAVDCPEDYRQMRLLVVPLAGSAEKLWVAARVIDPEVDATECAVAQGNAAPGLARLYDSFRKASAGELVPLSVARKAGLPRLLMIDSTPRGHASATGQLKQAFLDGWPREAFLQVWMDGDRLRLLRPGQDIVRSRGFDWTDEEILARCSDFQPDVVYVRPVDSDIIAGIADKVLERLDAPLVVHMMDDWPARLARLDPARHARAEAGLRRLVGRAQRLLAISGAMAEAFAVRYGGQWSPLANGADPDRYPPLPRPGREPGQPFVLHYMGALADDMTYASVRDVARAVSALSARLPVRFRIHTMDWCRGKAEADLGALPGVVVEPLVPQDRYEAVLGGADALLIAYNFDQASRDYIGYSLANKMPECLASGAPVLAYGPRGVATIDYLAAHGVAALVDERDEGALQAAIEALVVDARSAASLAAAARDHVRAHLSLDSVSGRFRDAMREAWAMGPFPRAASAHYDETDCVARLFDGPLSGSVMVDVGAHHGHALFPFVEKGWEVFAFEPDDGNRAILEKRLAASGGGASKVRLDHRAVSDRATTGLAFYRSDQSSGISGLSAFHPSHVSRQTVDTTTLADALADADVPSVDFLKIDTEGHDLFVLKGFPWDRFRPAVIECEFEDAKTVPLGYSFHDMAGYLEQRGYDVYVSEWHPIIRYGIRHDWRSLRRYPCELSDPAGWGNLLAFRDPIPEPELAGALAGLLKVRAPAPASGQQDPVLVAAPRRYRLAVDPAFERLSTAVWRYRHDRGATRAFWIAVVDAPGETAGRTFGATVRIKATAPMVLMASLGRLGPAAYEGVTERIVLAEGEERWVRLSSPFAHAHSGLKLQLYVERMAAQGTANLLVDSICICEIPEAHADTFREGRLDFRTANRWLREGRAADAAAVYRFLFAQHPLRMYRDNERTVQEMEPA